MGVSSFQKCSYKQECWWIFLWKLAQCENGSLLRLDQFIRFNDTISNFIKSLVSHAFEYCNFFTRLYTSFQFISAEVVLQKGYLHILRDIYHTQGNNKNCFHSHKRLRKENMAQTVSWLFSKWGKRLTLKGILQGEQISFTENRFGRRLTRTSTSQSQNFNSQLLRQILGKGK